VTLLEILVGQVQTNVISDLLDEPEEISANVRDQRPFFSDVHLHVVETLAKLATDCTVSVKKRVPNMSIVMRQAMDADRVAPSAGEMEALRAEIERGAAELQQLRAGIEVAELQRRAERGAAEKTCLVCFEGHVRGGMECPTGHFLCSEDSVGHVRSFLERVTADDSMLQQHRERGGRIKCVDLACEHCYTDVSIARALPDEVFHSYRAAQDQMVEHRIFSDLQQRFQQQLSAALAQASQAAQAATQRGAQEQASTAEFLRRQYPNARMCPQCQHGPVLLEGCYDLMAHHGEARAGGRRISNACPQCGFLGREAGQWRPWDGEMRI